MRCLRLLAAICVTLASAALAAGEADPNAILTDVVTNFQNFDERQIRKLTASLQGTKSADVLVVWLEAGNDWERIAQSVAMPYSTRRTELQRDVFLHATCIEALARTGHVAEARILSGWGDWSGTGTGPALGLAAQGRVAFQEKDWGLARTHLQQAHRALDLAQSTEGVGWQVTTAQRRLHALSQDIERAVLNDTLGPEYQLWSTAERLASQGSGDQLKEAQAAYDRVATEFPNGRFAGPALLEAARLAWAMEQGDACRTRLRDLLKRNDDQIHGLVCVLAADAEILFGDDQRFIRQVCQNAIDWCSAHRAATPLPEAVARVAAPTRHPHAMAGWGLPVWSQREQNRLWTWDAAPWLGPYVSYQALTRLIMVSVLAGNQRAAIDYAQNLARFDPLDQEMAQQGRQSGPIILAAAIRDRAFFLPLEAMNKLPATDQLRLMAALVHYQLYDWPSSRIWAESALIGLDLHDAARRNPLTYLIGYTWLGSHEDERALACWRRIAEDSRQTDRYWGLARMAEAAVRANSQHKQKEALAILVQVSERREPSAEAENALVRAVNLAETVDPAACKTAARRLLAIYPRSPYAHFAKEVLDRLGQKSSPSKDASP